jgi:hypothetical protein
MATAVAAAIVVGGFGVAASGPAAAAALPAPVVTARTTPAAEPSTGAHTPRERARATTGRTASQRVVIDSYTVAIGSQRTIDSCQLTLYWEQPLWFAAHNYCGYQWLATVPTGTVIVVRSGRAAGSYRVTGHATIRRQSGSLPSFDADLVLQTCVGSGTGFSLAERI